MIDKIIKLYEKELIFGILVLDQVYNYKFTKRALNSIETGVDISNRAIQVAKK